MSASLVVGPVQGYRYWRVEWDHGQPVLRSLYRATLWPAQDPLQATCEAKPDRVSAWFRQVLHRETARHVAPTWGCECGIYGLARFDRTENLEISPQCQRGLFGDHWQVAGVVLLWGRVVQHERGYRAEYARPAKLLAVPGLARGREIRDLLDAVAQRYAVDVVPDPEHLARAA